MVNSFEKNDNTSELFTIFGGFMKIYDFNGKKNLCGPRVKQARRMQGLSQSDLAARLQIEGVIIERDSISRIEIGTRFIADYELLIISKCLKVSPEWHLGLSDDSGIIPVKKHARKQL